MSGRENESVGRQNPLVRALDFVCFIADSRRKTLAIRHNGFNSDSQGLNLRSDSMSWSFKDTPVTVPTSPGKRFSED